METPRRQDSSRRHPPVIDYGVAAFEVPGQGSPLELTEFLENRPPESVSAVPPHVGNAAHHPEEISDSDQQVAVAIVEFLQLPEADDSVARTGVIPLAGDEPAGSTARAPRRPWLIARVFRKIFQGISWIVSTLFGIASLIVLLAVIAAIPIVNFLALGYLLEVEGRVARSGRLRDAFPLLGLAPRLGSIVLGIWLWLLPLRFVSHLANDAHLIDPGSGTDAFLQLFLIGVSGLVAVHLILAIARGGSFSCFFRPLKNIFWLTQKWRDGNYWQTAEQAVGEFVEKLRLKHHFLLGAKGFLGALAWLFLPTALLAAASKTEGGPLLLTLFGGFLLGIVLCWVPFLQAHLAAENRLGAMFELKRVRELYKHAPFSWLITMLVTLVLALPMYLFKAAVPPRDGLWLVTIVFVVSIYPAKVLTGWAYFRAARREKRTHWIWRWICWLPTLPLVFFYVFLLYFTQFIGKYGKLTLFEHHSFLLPSPYSFLN